MKEYAIPITFLVITLLSILALGWQVGQYYVYPNFRSSRREKIIEGIIWVQFAALVSSAVIIANLVDGKW